MEKLSDWTAFFVYRMLILNIFPLLLIYLGEINSFMYPN